MKQSNGNDFHDKIIYSILFSVASVELIIMQCWTFNSLIFELEILFKICFMTLLDNFGPQRTFYSEFDLLLMKCYRPAIIKHCFTMCNCLIVLLLFSCVIATLLSLYTHNIDLRCFFNNICKLIFCHSC